MFRPPGPGGPTRRVGFACGREVQDRSSLARSPPGMLSPQKQLRPEVLEELPERHDREVTPTRQEPLVLVLRVPHLQSQTSEGEPVELPTLGVPGLQSDLSCVPDNDGTRGLGPYHGRGRAGDVGGTSASG